MNGRSRLRSMNAMPSAVIASMLLSFSAWPLLASPTKSIP